MQLSPVEQNAVRYAGGYVIRKVITGYRKNDSSSYSASISCLANLILNDDDDDDDQCTEKD